MPGFPLGQIEISWLNWRDILLKGEDNLQGYYSVAWVQEDLQIIQVFFI